MFSVGIEKECWPEMIEVVVCRCSSGCFQIAKFTAKQTIALGSFFFNKVADLRDFRGIFWRDNFCM